MLFDLYTHLTTPCSLHIRGMGYLDEAIAMRGRYRRNRAAWQSHLGNTRRFVLSVAEKCRDRSKAVVLGSGLLLDVPLAELAALFREVVLMDVICLPEVRRQLRPFGNVRFVEYDATNVAERLYRSRQQGLDTLPESAPASSEINGNAGLVVSLNILSQLWVIPRTFAVRRRRELAMDLVEDWCRQLVEAHYMYVRSLAGDVCLVADYEFIKRGSDGLIFSRASTIYGLGLPAPDASWTWNIVPAGKDSRDSSKELTVGAWRFSASGR